MSDLAKHVSILELADLTGLPVQWLQREADAGRIPHIRAGRRRFFNVALAVQAISESSATTCARTEVSDAE